MKASVLSLLLLAFATSVAGSNAQSTGEAFQKHIVGLCDALSAYSGAVREHPEQVDRLRAGVVTALKGWRTTHQRLVRQLLEEDPGGSKEVTYRMRTATALCLAFEGLKDSDCDAFRADSGIEADWLYVKELIDYGNSMTY